MTAEFSRGAATPSRYQWLRHAVGEDHERATEGLPDVERRCPGASVSLRAGHRQPTNGGFPTGCLGRVVTLVGPYRPHPTRSKNCLGAVSLGSSIVG